MPEPRPDFSAHRPEQRRRVRRLMAWTVALASLSAACGPVSESSEAPESTEWTREGLEEQPRLELLRQGVSSSLGYEPGTTPWEEIPYSPPSAPPEVPPPDSPGAALANLVGALGWMDLLGEGVWEQTMRVWAPDSDQAVGVVLQWGLQDDAVAGRDLRAHMVRVEGTWQVERLERRFHCRRQVSEAGACA